SDTSSPVVTDPVLRGPVGSVSVPTATVASSPDLNRCRLSFGGNAQVCVEACRHRFYIWFSNALVGCSDIKCVGSLIVVVVFPSALMVCIAASDCFF
ncbi:hypothetical protein A2U01_0062342, partial [Trifolium medium]|nr:hypothetical protein [Trifolium medium]